jgi:hypothetical protein
VAYLRIIYLSISMKGLRKGFYFLNKPPADRRTDPRGNKHETGNIKTQPQSSAPSF